MTLSHRAPSQVMLDDEVSSKTVREEAGWHPVSKALVSGMLDDILGLTSRDRTRMRVGKSRPRWCLTAGRRQAPLERVLGDALS